MPQKGLLELNENDLPKGQLRKLNALRKFVGEVIGNRAFGQWLKEQKKGNSGRVDNTAKLNGERLATLIAEIENQHPARRLFTNKGAGPGYRNKDGKRLTGRPLTI